MERSQDTLNVDSCPVLSDSCGGTETEAVTTHAETYPGNIRRIRWRQTARLSALKARERNDALSARRIETLGTPFLARSLGEKWGFATDPAARRSAAPVLLFQIHMPHIDNRTPEKSLSQPP